MDKISHFEPLMSSECDSGAKKLMESPNNVRNVLRNITVVVKLISPPRPYSEKKLDPSSDILFKNPVVRKKCWTPARAGGGGPSNLPPPVI